MGACCTVPVGMVLAAEEKAIDHEVDRFVKDVQRGRERDEIRDKHLRDRSLDREDRKTAFADKDEAYRHHEPDLLAEVAKAMVGDTRLSEEKKGYLYEMTGEAKGKANSREGSKANSRGSSTGRSPIATPRTPRSARRSSKEAASASGGSESGSGAFDASGKRRKHRGVPNDTSHDLRNQPSSVEDAEKVEKTGPKRFLPKAPSVNYGKVGAGMAQYRAAQARPMLKRTSSTPGRTSSQTGEHIRAALGADRDNRNVRHIMDEAQDDGDEERLGTDELRKKLVTPTRASSNEGKTYITSFDFGDDDEGSSKRHHRKHRHKPHKNRKPGM